MTDGFTILARRGSDHQESHAAALAEGFRAHGIPVELVYSLEQVRTEHVACWGWRAGSQLRAQGREVLVMERGYMGDRFAWTSLGWNGLNNRAQFGISNDVGARFRKHFGHLLQPWNPAGDYVLLIGQVPGDMSLRGRNLAPWYAEQAARAAALFKLPVRFRQHPEAVRRGIRQEVRGTTAMGGDLQPALAGAAVVVTFNSNTGVDSLLAGKPTLVGDEGSMAWDVANLLTPGKEPDRESWAARLAWCQWKMDEIRSGEAWAVAGSLSPRQRAAA